MKLHGYKDQYFDPQKYSLNEGNASCEHHKEKILIKFLKDKQSSFMLANLNVRSLNVNVENFEFGFLECIPNSSSRKVSEKE